MARPAGRTEPRSLTHEGIDWSQLTVHPKKPTTFGIDPGFRVSFEIALASCGSADVLYEFLLDHALLVIKPEATLSGRALPVLEFLDEQRLEIIRWTSCMLDFVTSHLLWKYSWTKATVDRMRLHVEMSRGAPSYLLLVRGRGRNRSPVPLSCRLSELKGSSDAKRRGIHHLRTALGMCNRMISFVHVSDEPADVLRELGLLAPPILATMPIRTPDRAGELWRELEEASKSVHWKDYAEVRRRQSSSCARWLDHAMTRRSLGEFETLDGVLRNLAQLGVIDPWDRWVLAAEIIQHDIPGKAATFESPTIEELIEGWWDLRRSQMT